MKDSIILELCRRWEQAAIAPEYTVGNEEAKIQNAIDLGRRECYRECSDTLRTLVSLIGEIEPKANK
jgi:hypothetical protein